MLTWIKWACLSLTVGSVLAALFILWQPASQEPAEVVADAGQAESRIQVDKPLLVEHEGENVIWRLEADKAEQNLDGSMLLIAPRLELFTESGRTLRDSKSTFASLPEIGRVRPGAARCACGGDRRGALGG